MSNYKPGALLDVVKAEFDIYTDKSLAKSLGMSHSDLSFVRTHRAPLSADLILRIHNVTGWGVDYIRGLAGDESEGFFRKPVGGKFNWEWRQS